MSGLISSKPDACFGVVDILMNVSSVLVLDSERSDDCIDFIMMCMGGFLYQIEYPWYIKQIKSKKLTVVFKRVRKNHKKVTENIIFLYCCNSKTNHLLTIRVRNTSGRNSDSRGRTTRPPFFIFADTKIVCKSECRRKYGIQISDNHTAIIRHDFFVDNEISWYYDVGTIHTGRQIQTSTYGLDWPISSPD
ncbi:hypothetical protein FWK35_00025256 [Aphis craccivora]|uniref:Uncharacterized protein n=1 Tax=Aphis craccivora TaxID=307492 RepID=A0A6G0Y956_APHCR|nr:hypothetical protein FWK35_00025256 [Aphis craccivora]